MNCERCKKTNTTTAYLLITNPLIPYGQKLCELCAIRDIHRVGYLPAWCNCWGYGDYIYVGVATVRAGHPKQPAYCFRDPRKETAPASYGGEVVYEEKLERLSRLNDPATASHSLEEGPKVRGPVSLHATKATCSTTPRNTQTPTQNFLQT